MQGIYNYIFEATHISGVYNFPAVLHSQFMQHVLFFPVLNMFCAFLHHYFPQYVCSAQYGCFL